MKLDLKKDLEPRSLLGVRYSIDFQPDGTAEVHDRWSDSPPRAIAAGPAAKLSMAIRRQVDQFVIQVLAEQVRTQPEGLAAPRTEWKS